MTTIQLTLSGASAMAKVSGIITSGMVGLPVTIAYDSAWEGLTKSLVCRSSSGVYSILDVDGHTFVAPEALQCCAGRPNPLYLGVEGRNRDGTLVIPSTMVYCGDILPGADPLGDTSVTPDSPAWVNVMSFVGKPDFLLTDARDSLVAAINETKRDCSTLTDVFQTAMEDGSFIGPQGPRGEDRESAYAQAVAAGYGGSEEDFCTRMAALGNVVILTQGEYYALADAGALDEGTLYFVTEDVSP